MACSESSTNAEIKGRIKNIWTKFVMAVEPERLSDWLVQEDVITPDQWQRIHNNYPTKESRCRGLLYHLFSIPHPRAFLVVRRALVEDNHYLLELIDNQGPRSRIMSMPDIQTALQGYSTHIHDTEKIEQHEKNYADKNRVWEEEKDRLLEMQEEHKDQKRAWEEEKGRLLKMQNEYEHQKRGWEEEKDRLLKMQNEHGNQKRAWEEEKVRVLKMQNEEHEHQKRVWEADKDRLLKMQKDMETKLQLANIEQQKLEKERKLCYKEKEQLLEQIQELRESLDERESEDAARPHILDDSSARVDRWSRSIIIENVSQDMFSTLKLLLENKSIGGGNIITYERDPTSSHVLATFEKLEAAENFLAAEKLNMMRQIFSVRRPLLLEEEKGQNSNASSDIEEISRDEADRFTFVDLHKQGSSRHTGDDPSKRQPSDIQPSALSKDATPPHSSDSSSCGTPESFDESSARKADQWSRSIIIENVPQDMFSTLKLLLENKSMGGGNIITYERDPTSNHVLAVFEEIQAAANFLAAEKLKVLRQVFSIRRPLLLEVTEDTL